MHHGVVALLAEELVEEWLNRAGFFTIRGAKLGVHEMDLLGVRFSGSQIECRHIEVQASVNPISYITRLSKIDEKLLGRKATSVKKRSGEELARGVDEWVLKKFGHAGKAELLRRLAPGPWSRELVVHRLRFPEELALLRERGILVHQLEDVVADLLQLSGPVARAAGGDFSDLVFLGRAKDSL